MQKNITPLISKKNVADIKSKEMYNGNKYVMSELISSYAWDTALNFICQTNKEGYTLATTNSTKYGNIGTGKLEKTGMYKNDKYSNLYDILGNCIEWTTEYCYGGPYTARSGSSASSTANASYRMLANGSGGPTVAFRVQMYIK